MEKMKLNHKTTKKLRKKAKQTRNNNTKKGKIPDQNVAKKILKLQSNVLFLIFSNAQN